MALPRNRQEFKDYCLRKLGEDVIEVNVSYDQVEDRIDEALDMYQDYHYDGIVKCYLKHRITAENKTNKYIVLDELIRGVVGVFPVANFVGSASSLFNTQYQFALNELFNISSKEMLPYYLAMRQIENFNYWFNNTPSVRFNRHTDKLHIDTNWDNLPEGSYIIIDCYRVVDPETYSDIWSDRWLINYTVALIEMQWGRNLGKFKITLPGNTTYSGDEIYNRAKDDLDKLKEELINSYSAPVNDMIG